MYRLYVKMPAVHAFLLNYSPVSQLRIADNAEEECLEHYEMLRNAGRFKSPSTRGLVVGFFAGVPRGCSIQMNSYPGTDADMSPHFNTKRDTDGSRAVPGSAISRPGSRRGAELSEFLPICDLSKTVTFPASQSGVPYAFLIFVRLS